MRRSFLLLAVFFTLRAIISATLSVHLIAVLGGLGLSVTAAVAAAALMGPAQVGGRLLEFTLGRAAHPLTAARLGGALLPLGALLLVLAGPVAAVPFVLLYGASNGIMTISRGALPLGAVRAARLSGADGQAGPADPAGPGGGADADRAAGGGSGRRPMVLGLAGLLALAALACLLPLRRAP